MTEPSDDLKEALRITIQVMEIASDWNAPMSYDIEIPDSWRDTVDPDGDEPTWPTLYGIIRKCKEVLND